MSLPLALKPDHHVFLEFRTSFCAEATTHCSDWEVQNIHHDQSDSSEVQPCGWARSLAMVLVRSLPQAEGPDIAELHPMLAGGSEEVSQLLMQHKLLRVTQHCPMQCAADLAVRCRRKRLHVACLFAYSAFARSR